MKGYAHPIEGTEPKQWCNEEAQETPLDVGQPQTKGAEAQTPKMLTEQQFQMLKDFVKTNRVTTSQIKDYTGRVEVKTFRDLTEDEAQKVLMAIQTGQLGKPLADTARR